MSLDNAYHNNSIAVLRGAKPGIYDLLNSVYCTHFDQQCKILNVRWFDSRGAVLPYKKRQRAKAVCVRLREFNQVREYLYVIPRKQLYVLRPLCDERTHPMPSAPYEYVYAHAEVISVDILQNFITGHTKSRLYMDPTPDNIPERVDRDVLICARSYYTLPSPTFAVDTQTQMQDMPHAYWCALTVLTISLLLHIMTILGVFDKK